MKTIRSSDVLNDLGSVLSPKIDTIPNPKARAHSVLLSMSDCKYDGLIYIYGFYGAYNYSGLVRQVSGFIIISVIA